MNGNRVKYAVTPAAGIHKRSFLKRNKKPIVAETPDFSNTNTPSPNFAQVPDTAVPPFAQQPYTPVQSYSPVQSAAPSAFQQQYYSPTPIQTPNTYPSQMNGMPSAPATPDFSQQAVVSFPQSQSMNNSPAFQPVNQHSPLISQGYTPNPSVSSQQQNLSFQPVQSPQVHSFSATAAPNFVQTPAAGFQQPFTQSFNAAPSFDSNEQKHSSANPSKLFPTLWGLFLFILIPIFFVICLFLPEAYDSVRYLFLASAMIAVGVTWFLKLYSPSTRAVVTIIISALVLVSAIMLFKQGQDITKQPEPNEPIVSNINTNTDIEQESGEINQPSPTPSAEPTPAGPSQAELRLALFMNLWEMNNPTEMVALVQPSWCNRQQNPSEALFKLLKNRTPESYTIEQIDGTETDNSRTITMKATINKNTGKAPTVYRFMVMMVKEGDEWYVNPNSLASNDEQTVTEENVVNNKNAVGNVTEAPRTTVSPAPPATTSLYYNEGAHYYHMDPNCPSVGAEYLPFDHEFPYSDLQAVRNAYGLSPCLKCGAPTDVLN